MCLALRFVLVVGGEASDGARGALAGLADRAMKARQLEPPGAMLGGFLIGLIQTLSDQYLATQWTNAVIFGILVAILVFRPTGLLGEDVGQKA